MESNNSEPSLNVKTIDIDECGTSDTNCNVKTIDIDECGTSESSLNVKTIDLDNSNEINPIKKKSPKGRNSVLKASDFKSEAESARFTKKVMGVTLPCNFIQ